jgi:hypothetical protein
MLAKRRPEAVRVLEELQQQERASAGDPPITRDMVVETLRKSLLQKELLKLDKSEAISEFPKVEAQVEKQLASILHQEQPNILQE